MFADVAETYGRTLDIRTIEASGGPADATAAQADAQKVDRHGRVRRDRWTRADAGVVAGDRRRQDHLHVRRRRVGDRAAHDNAPYLWPTGPTPEQADAHLLELVGKQLVGKKAEFAGDPALQAQDRVFGWVQAETETGEYKARNDAFDAAAGGRVRRRGRGAARRTSSTRRTRPTSRRPSIARMKEAGVTTIIISTDPLIPAADHRRGDEAELLPRVGDRSVRARRHDDLRSHVRPAAVGARDRPVVADRPRPTATLDRLVHVVPVVLRQGSRR